MTEYGCVNIFLRRMLFGLQVESMYPPGHVEGIERERKEGRQEWEKQHAAVFLQSRIRLWLRRRRLTTLVVKLQAAQRARMVRATPLARSVRLFLRERRRALLLERSLGRMP